MPTQLMSTQASIASLHLKPSLPRPHKLITPKPSRGSLPTQNKRLDFWAEPADGRTRSLRCRASTNADTDGAISPEASPQGIYSKIDFKFEVKDICELTVSGNLDGAASKGASSLVALYNFYYNRSKALAESVVELLENADKDLKSELEQDISVENLIQRLKDAPRSALKTLDSMKLLITLCRSVAPAVAQEVETSMRAEYLQLKEKAKNEASEVSTDTPFNVLANSSSDFNLTEGGSGSGGGESESAKQAPIRNAFKLANSPYWDGWKFQLRSALITTPTPTPKPAYAVCCCIETRSADDTEMKAWLDVVAGGSPSLGSIATKGPHQDADPALKAFLLFEYLHYPESSMLDSLSSMCWKVAQIPQPEKFKLVFYDTVATDDDCKADEEESEFIIEGSGEELKVLLLVLAGLESGELSLGIGGGQSKRKKALTPWIPADARIQIRQLQDGTSYEMRAALNDSDVEHSAVLSSRQICAVIDCLDSFCELHPSFGLNEPTVEWPKTPLVRQLAATFNL